MCDRVAAAAGVSSSGSEGLAGTHSRAGLYQSRTVFDGRRAFGAAPARLSRRRSAVSWNWNIPVTSPHSCRSRVIVTAEAPSSSDGAAVQRPPRSRGVVVRQTAPATGGPGGQAPSSSAASTAHVASVGAAETATAAESAEPAAPKTLLRRRVQAAKKNVWTITAPEASAAPVPIQTVPEKSTEKVITSQCAHISPVYRESAAAAPVCMVLFTCPRRGPSDRRGPTWQRRACHGNAHARAAWRYLHNRSW